MEVEVKAAIGKGKVTSTPGPDGLGSNFYLAYANLLAGPLAHAFNQVLVSRGMPSARGLWRKAPLNL